MKPIKRPGCGHATATPVDESLIQILGIGASHEGVALTRDQFQAIKRLYGYYPEPPVPKPPPPPPLGPNPSWEQESRHKEVMRAYSKWEDPSPFHQAGADRNAMRWASSDGLRMLAWIAKYVPPESDPVKALIQLAIDAGWDIDPATVEWVNEEEV
jgi:hypothetical protein